MRRSWRKRLTASWQPLKLPLLWLLLLWCVRGAVCVLKGGVGCQCAVSRRRERAAAREKKGHAFQRNGNCKNRLGAPAHGARSTQHAQHAGSARAHALVVDVDVAAGRDLVVQVDQRVPGADLALVCGEGRGSVGGEGSVVRGGGGSRGAVLWRAPGCKGGANHPASGRRRRGNAAAASSSSGDRASRTKRSPSRRRNEICSISAAFVVSLNQPGRTMMRPASTISLALASPTTALSGLARVCVCVCVVVGA